MTSYADEIVKIRQAASLEDIRNIARNFSAKASGEGGILYSGPVGDVTSEAIAKELALRTGVPIINETPRAKFLAEPEVEAAIKSSAKRIFVSSGEPVDLAKRSAAGFLYGDASRPAGNPISPEGCLWGEASGEFAGSLSGEVTIIAVNANAERVFGRVELPLILKNPGVTALASQSIARLRALQAEGGIEAVLPAVQAQFIEASNKGIFTLPNHRGSTSTQISISREVAEALQLDPTRFASSQYLAAADFVPAPVGVSTAPAVDARETTGLLAAEVPTRGGLHPSAVKAGGAVAAAAVVYDLTTSASKASGLWEQGNHTGAKSEVIHFATRNLGMWGGAVLGAEAFGTGGAETGPLDVVVGGAGALVGAIAGGTLADMHDRQRIYSQRGADGNVWSYDPERPAQGWTRTVNELDTEASRLNDGFPVYRQHNYTANAQLSDQLNYQASSAAVELALAHPPLPRDPCTQPAVPGDAHSLREAPWIRDAQTHAWTRRVVDQVLEHGIVSSHVEKAAAARAAALDRAADQTTARNLAQSPQAAATRYQTAYRDYGWDRHGPPPEAVSAVLREADRNLLASDGNTYTRTPQGDWTTPGRLFGTSTAAGSIKAELEASWRQQQEMRTRSPLAGSAEPLPATTVPASVDAPAPQRGAGHASQAVAVSVSTLEHLRDFRQPGHPMHALYEQALAKVHDMEDLHQMPYGVHSERLAAAATDAIAAYNTGKVPQERFGTLARVELRGEGAGRQVVLVEERVNYHMPAVQISLSADKAVARSVGESSQDWSRRHMPHLHAATPAREPQAPKPARQPLPAHDPRRADHPRHAQFVALRGQVAEAYAHAGIQRSAAQLDQATAATMLHTHHGRAEESPGRVSLLADQRTGVIGAASDLLLEQPHGSLVLRSRVPVQEFQAAPDQALVPSAQGQQPQHAQQAQVR